MTHPNTREVLLEGLRQALQARVVKLYTVLSSAGEQNTAERGMAGLKRAVEAYEHAWKYIEENFAE
jgi:hypothetical protein